MSEIRTFGTDKEFITTYTGKKVYPLVMRPQDIDFLDIAHALSNKCRFTGHTSKFYSVAEHSVAIANQGEKEHKFPGVWGLFHDAAEAYLPDIAGPIKHRFPLLKMVEQLILVHIKTRFHLRDLVEEEIRAMKQADISAQWWEAKKLLPVFSNVQEPQPFEIPIYCWSPEKAEEEFIKIGREFLFNYL